jgi:hypothetical protein
MKVEKWESEFGRVTIICPSGATYPNTQCCFSKLAQRVGWVHNRYHIHSIITCSRYDIANTPGWVYNRHHIQ